MIRNSTTSEIRFYNKGFTEFSVVGGNKLVGYSNNTVTPVVKFEGRGGVRVSADPLTNTMFIQGVPTAISTAAYAFGQINVISNASTFTPGAIGNSNNAVLTAVSPSSLVTVLGLGDIRLYTNTTSNAYFIGISSFSSAEYLNISSTTYNLYGSTLSTVSTLFYDVTKTGVATSSLKNLISNVSTGIDSNFNYFNTFFIQNYTSLNYFGLNSTLTGNTIANMQSDINYLYIQQGVIDIGSLQQTSTATGTNTTTLSSFKGSFTTSTIRVSSIGVNCNSPQYNVDINGTLNAISINTIRITTTEIDGYPSQIQLNSTVRGLGTSGYISTTGLESTVTGLGSIGYISTSSLESTVIGLGNQGYISSSGVESTVIGLGNVGYISSSGLQSTVRGLASIGYISTTQIGSTIDGLGSIGYVSTSFIESTVIGLGTSGYVSSFQLQDTINNLGSYGYISTTGLESTAIGLASIGYISTTQIGSTIDGLASIGYISTSQLTSTGTGLGSIGYISSTQLVSTVGGIFNIGYVSTGNIESTIIGLGSSGYISTTGLESTVIGLGSSGYISTTGLESTVIGLGNVGYVSTASLRSSLTGLGSIGYISSTQLISTVSGLGTNINFFSTLPQLNTNTSLGSLLGNNILLSSVQFRVNSMSSMIEKGATAYLRVFPNFGFDKGNETDQNVRTTINTRIYIDNTIIPNTAFSRLWSHTFSTLGVYTDSIQIELNNSDLTANIESTFTVCHDFSSLYSAGNNIFTQTENGCSIHLCSPR